MKTNDRAQGSQMMLLMLLMFIMLFIFGDPNIRVWIAITLHSIFYPVIGFNGNFPILTIILAGVIVVFLSSFFQNLFMDWKKMAKAKQITKAFQDEIRKARKQANPK